MKGIENMILNMLKGMGFDPEIVKNETLKRIQNFENNVATLNGNMEIIANRLAAIELKLGIENGNGNHIGRLETGVGETENSASVIGD